MLWHLWLRGQFFQAPLSQETWLYFFFTLPLFVKGTASSLEKETCHQLLIYYKMWNILYSENELLNVINYNSTLKFQLHLGSHGKCKIISFIQDYI